MQIIHGLLAHADHALPGLIGLLPPTGTQPLPYFDRQQGEQDKSDKEEQNRNTIEEVIGVHVRILCRLRD